MAWGQAREMRGKEHTKSNQSPTNLSGKENNSHWRRHALDKHAGGSFCRKQTTAGPQKVAWTSNDTLQRPRPRQPSNTSQIQPPTKDVSARFQPVEPFRVHFCVLPCSALWLLLFSRLTAGDGLQPMNNRKIADTRGYFP